jgi:hypothetical protein
VISPFSRLRRALRGGRGEDDAASPPETAPEPPPQDGGSRDHESADDVEQRIDAARRRLKATIPPRSEE